MFFTIASAQSSHLFFFFFFSSRRRHTRSDRDWSSDVCSSDLVRRDESMLQIPGPPALSAFRIAKLLGRLGALEPAVTRLAARFMHFVELAQPLSGPEREVLAQLLTYGPRLEAPAPAGARGGLS